MEPIQILDPETVSRDERQRQGDESTSVVGGGLEGERTRRATVGAIATVAVSDEDHNETENEAPLRPHERISMEMAMDRRRAQQNRDRVPSLAGMPSVIFGAMSRIQAVDGQTSSRLNIAHAELRRARRASTSRPSGEVEKQELASAERQLQRAEQAAGIRRR